VNNSSINLLEKLLREKGRFDGSPISESEVQQFLLYYELVLKWNHRLHLTTLVDPHQFFKLHLLESDFAASLLLPNVTQVWDLGSGLGIPGIPISILRQDLFIHLVEARRHKGIFLEEVISFLASTNVVVLNARIETLPPFKSGDCLTARAVERMAELVPAMMKLGAESSQMLLIGSELLGSKIIPFLPSSLQVNACRIPISDRRYVFNILRST